MRALAPGDLIAGKFRLERVVGRGGMGSVWAARHEQLGMMVALKFIEVPEGAEHSGAMHDAADARARFEREARAAGMLRSPHVVQILDHGTDGDRQFIAMELLEGEDMGERLRREGRLAPAAAARIAVQVAKALKRAHEAGVIHRDLKPGNIFLARFDDDEVVKVLDFGVAKLQQTGAIEGAQATQVGVVFGSPSYMSPEQARGVRTLDHRSDLWSFAVILFRAVTGAKPFEASTIADLVIKLCIDPLPVPSHYAPDLPPALDAFFARAFAREPEQRFATAQELAAAFEAAVNLGQTRPAAPSFSALPAPPPPSSSPFAQPGPGSGPHVAFSPGTLTPPPEVAPPPPDGWRIGPPQPVVPPPPPSAPATAVPIPPRPPLETQVTRVPSGIPPRQLALLAVMGGSLLVIVILLVVVIGQNGDPAPAAGQPPASATTPSAKPPPPPPPPPPETASAAPPPATSATADPASSGDPEAPVTPPPPDAGAHPFKSTKKKHPNFGY